MFTVMWILSFIGILLFLFIKKPTRVAPFITRVRSFASLSPPSSEQNRINITYTSESKSRLVSSTSAGTLRETSRSRMTKVQPHKPSLKSTLSVWKSLKMIQLSFLITLSGIIVAFYSGLLIALISNSIKKDKKEDKLSKSLYCMILLGVGEIVGATVIGQIVDRLGNRMGIITSWLTVIATLIITYYVNKKIDYTSLWFLVTLLWGLSDSTINLVWTTIWAIEFSSPVEPFAIFKSIQSLITCIFYLVESSINKPEMKDAQKWYMIGIGIFTIVAWISSSAIKFLPKSSDFIK